MRRILWLRVAVSALLAGALTFGSDHTVAVAADPEADTCSAAVVAGSRNVWLSGSLESTADVDWFLFKKTSATGALSTLGSFPGNNRLELYAACDTRLASSDVKGNAFEDVFRSLTAGTYRLRVSHVGGAVGAYQLRFLERSNCAWLSYRSWTGTDGQWNAVGEVLNATAETQGRPLLQAIFHYPSGSQEIVTFGASPLMEFAPGGRTPFKMSHPVAPGYDRMWIKTVRCLEIEPDWHNFPVVASSSFIDTAGRRQVIATLFNHTRFDGFNIHGAATLYDSLGRVTNVANYAIGDGDDDGFVPLATEDIEIIFPDRHKANRYRVVGAGQTLCTVAPCP